MDGGRGRHHAMLSASMPSYPPISIHPHLPAHRPPPMGWLCLPVCLQTNQSDHRVRTQKKKEEEDRLTAGVAGKTLLHSHSSDLWRSGVLDYNLLIVSFLSALISQLQIRVGRKMPTNILQSYFLILFLFYENLKIKRIFHVILFQSCFLVLSYLSY